MDQHCAVIYFSQSHHTETVAKHIQALAGGQLVRIQAIQPYPNDYRALVERVKQEIADGVFPPVEQPDCDFNGCDIFYVGSPNWCGQIAPPLAGFLKSLDLAGKTVAPFVTHGGGGSGKAAEEIPTLCPGATVTELLEVHGDGGESVDEEITAWRHRNQL